MKVQELWKIEKQYIIRALAKHRGNKTKASLDLDVTVKTLYNKLYKYQMMQTKDWQALVVEDVPLPAPERPRRVEEFCNLMHENEDLKTKLGNANIELRTLREIQKEGVSKPSLAEVQNPTVQLFEQWKTLTRIARDKKLENDKYELTNAENFAVAMLSGVPYFTKINDGESIIKLTMTTIECDVKWTGSQFQVARRG